MNPKERTQLISEFRILSELNHPNIVQYVHHAHIPEQHMLYLYMEYCDGGDLSYIIKNYRNSNEYLPEGIIWNIFTQILMALYRCHYGVNSPIVKNIYEEMEFPTITDTTKIVIHRDIKPDNIFLSDGKFKLGDFGLAKSLEHEIEFATTCVGTPYYMSPEILLDQPYTPLCDIWSLGCVIYELCALHPPFQAKTHLQLQKKIQEGIYPDIPEHYSASLRRIISYCIQVDINQRLPTFELLQHLNFKIQMKDLQLNNYELNLKKFEDELMLKENELIRAKQSLSEELNYQRKLIEQEVEEIRINYQNEFQYVVEKEVRSRLKQMQIGSTPKSKTPMAQQTLSCHPSPSDFSMVTSPGTPAGAKVLKGPRELETPSHSRLPLTQILDNDPPISKKYTKPTNSGYAPPSSSKKSNGLIAKNAKLFEGAFNDNNDVGPFQTKYNNNWF
ncbi:SNF1-like protein kinase [Wickerhamomyces ciferrii]|uniref:non-specific serine/threonine protein kinase n=1 Tax=Wickerhamomyces ciferrii (strain ATCC 14091 / BCRC 22168 / CBS 111 / JCM 3599 / NBRC 0793 / NRRL Y-1031 F-60-10) TaxID=1206466 RepID=K0KKB0_WICCF|nr:SNF1-like protein kinase [Wickerhamomyces ciferrii]CCH41563.1 SNF1-like protein kinase [Wickerhamomyces ciferrii]